MGVCGLIYAEEERWHFPPTVSSGFMCLKGSMCSQSLFWISSRHGIRREPKLGRKQSLKTFAGREKKIFGKMANSTISKYIHNHRAFGLICIIHPLLLTILSRTFINEVHALLKIIIHSWISNKAWTDVVTDEVTDRGPTAGRALVHNHFS